MASAPSFTSFTSTQLDLHAAARTHLQRRWETHLVEPVVEDHVEPVDDTDRPEQPGGRPQGQEPVLDGGAERARRRALGVDVDVLLVTGEFGERVDVLLGGLDPIADTEHRANSIAQAGKTLEYERLPRITRCGIDSHWSPLLIGLTELKAGIKLPPAASQTPAGLASPPRTVVFPPSESATCSTTSSSARRSAGDDLPTPDDRDEPIRNFGVSEQKP